MSRTLDGTPRARARSLFALAVGAALALGSLGALAPQASAADAAPGTFTSLVPTRILDTRDGTGQDGAAKVPGGGEIEVQVGGVADVPADASAVVLNVTATRGTAGGHVTAYPTGTDLPTASHLNFAAGQTIAGAVTVQLGEGGAVTLANGSSAPVDLVADVAGWYAGGEPTVAGSFTSLAPSRLLDTRTGTGGTAALVPGGGTIDVQVAGAGGVPAEGASAAALTVTVTQPQGPGHVTAYPAGAATPTASNLNFSARQTIANAVTVQLGEDGAITLKNGANAPVHLVVDVAGWFAAGEPTAAGAFSPTGPARVLDTRSGAPVPAGGSVPVQIAGFGDVPETGVAAALLNVTATRAQRPGHVTVHPSDSPVPTASNLNFVAGQTIANQVTVKLSADGRATLVNGSTGPVHLVVDVGGWYAGAPATVSPLRASVDKPAGADTNVLDLTPDSRFVLFTAYDGARTSLHVFDTATGETSLVSAPADLVPDDPDAAGVTAGAISDDGRFVAFDSDASDLVAEDANGVSDVFVRDLVEGSTVRVEGAEGELADGAFGPVISGDGSTVVYVNPASPAGLDAYDVATATATPLEPGEGVVYASAPSIDEDGSVVSFAGDGEEGPLGVFAHDVATGTTTLISAEGATGVLATQIDAAGDTVAWSEASPDLEGAYQAFVRDWTAGTPAKRISEDVPLSEEDVYPTSISADGNRVALYATEFVDPDFSSVVFVFDVPTSAFIEVPGSGAGWAVLDADGGRVAFSSIEALTEDDTDEAIDVYVADVD